MQNISNINYHVVDFVVVVNLAMEVLLPKLPSFKFPSPSHCCSITIRSSSIVRFGLRRVSSLSVSASTVNEAVAQPAIDSPSLGHSTRPHFPILHQVSFLLHFILKFVFLSVAANF